ncbi:MAG: J domain-containing protein [Rhodobacteraceae bacterium]|nr:J domain-containing protein [Paracoccaceae bacterium]
MNNSSLDFDISISAAKQKNRRKSSGVFEASQQTCHFEGCQKNAQFRAPVAPDRLNEFCWFCEEHIGQYNIQWNYYDSTYQRIDDEEFAQKITNRANNKQPFTWSRFGVNDPLDVLQDQQTEDAHHNSSIKLNKTERRAAEILNLEIFTRAEARKKYRSLVKYLHPDLKSGDRADEKRLREVVWAWKQIKNNRKFES